MIDLVINNAVNVEIEKNSSFPTVDEITNFVRSVLKDAETDEIIGATVS
jgi:hypothetical protein